MKLIRDIDPTQKDIELGDQIVVDLAIFGSFTATCQY